MSLNKILLFTFVISFLITYNSIVSNKEKNTLINTKRYKNINVDNPVNITKKTILNKDMTINYDLVSKNNVAFLMTNTQLSVKEILNIDSPYSFLEIYFLDSKNLQNYATIIEGKLIDESIEQVIIENIPVLYKKPIQYNLKFKDTLSYIDFLIKELKSRELNYIELENIIIEIKNVQSSIRVLRDYADTEEVKYFLFEKLEKQKNRYINVFNEFSDNN
tara:strand:- start:462 stop:1118 length:657 start_codon:yes stop_codon:yes gene_type:complete